MTQLPLTHTPGSTEAEGTVHLVVSCTNTKRRPPAPGLRIRDLPRLPGESRADEWVRRIVQAGAGGTPARDLYAGDHWSTALSLLEIAAGQGLRAELWVLSAGYGLVPVDHPMVPYSATFTPGTPDCVGTGPEALRWWDRLAESPPLATGRPRTLTGLAQQDPDAHIVIAAALPYLHPIASDAGQAAAVLTSPDRLMVVSAGARTTVNGLTPYLVPIDSRLLHSVGGSRIALNVRATAFILESADTTGLDRSDVVRNMSAHLESLPAAPTYDRTPMTDDEVLAYVGRRLSDEPHLSATRMLRDLRRQGRACEQGRFHDLVRRAKGSRA